MSDSRRRATRGSQDEAVGHTNGVGGRSRPERATDTGEEDEGAGPSGIQEEYDDPAQRREIRSQYRDLINSVQREFQHWEFFFSFLNKMILELLLKLLN